MERDLKWIEPVRWRFGFGYCLGSVRAGNGNAARFLADHRAFLGACGENGIFGLVIPKPSSALRNSLPTQRSSNQTNFFKIFLNLASRQVTITSMNVINMIIQEYLKETRHAASTLINAVTAEWEQHKMAVNGYNRTVDDFSRLEPSRSNIHLLGAAVDSVTNSDIRVQGCLLHRLEKIPSTAILCGALLQLAKQGLSSVYGAKANVPKGKEIGATTLRDVIWEGRNQAMHFEEGKHKPELTDCFRALEVVFGAQFSLKSKRNLSLYVIDALGWSTLAVYEADMMSLSLGQGSWNFSRALPDEAWLRKNPFDGLLVSGSGRW
jgi:hypothetical protein